MVCAGIPTMPAAAADMAWFVQAGDGDRATREATIGLTRQLWAGSMGASGWSVYGEAEIGEWFTHDHPDDDRSRFTHIGLTPVVRYSFGAGAFVEAGIGAQLVVPRFHDEGRQFSTVYQFGDHLALGRRFGDAAENEVSFRIEHFSNGGLRNPNPGQNFLELRYTRHF